MSAISIKSSSRVDATGISHPPGPHGVTQYHAETSSFMPAVSSLRRPPARSFGSGPFLHGMADVREFATACFVWGCIAATGLALFIAWFVASTLIYFG
ncbi:hypothetical protein GA0061099_102126 [Bradyrhizobium yuanmingense]|uniref:Uncharacterized protein n=1 Tax=Bradyrhizobium yuanmingense TaxID=108015 RepID=A0A1C3XHH7_9BRAD|nr:hypothetical protein [Bradyrhizobium yuanmingense]TWI18965.1 hypothetical protein IQ15_06991 [Bradyrhizobium yuanmingense]SCB51720.1 hypothetical protein GA0061099_102126 [Bradyrhizobium yuanmingense]